MLNDLAAGELTDVEGLEDMGHTMHFRLLLIYVCDHGSFDAAEVAVVISHLRLQLGPDIILDLIQAKIIWIAILGMALF